MKVDMVLVLAALVYTVLVLNDSGDIANFCRRFS